MDELVETNGERRAFYALLTLAIAPSLVAMWGMTQDVAGREFAAAAESPLAFRAYHLRRGDVAPEPTIPFFFPFNVNGDVPVRITDIKPSCGCLTPRLMDFDGSKELSNRVLAPSSKASIYVGVATANETPGPHRYTVDVTYDDGAVHTETIAFELVIPEQKVLIEPQQMLFYQMTGASDSRPLTITDARGKNLRVLSAELSQPVEGVSLTVGSRIRTSEGHWQTPIHVDVAGEVPTARQSAYIVVHTDDAEFNKLLVPLMVHGRPTTIQQASADMIEGREGPSLPTLPSPR